MPFLIWKSSIQQSDLTGAIACACHSACVSCVTIHNSMYCMHVLYLCDVGIWHNSFCQSQKFLLKSLACLCPRQCRQDYQLCRQPGPSRKVMSPFITTIFSTGYMGLLPGAVRTPSFILKPLLLCHWQLALNTMSEWEQCLMWELECGVQCRQREHIQVSFCNGR